MNDTECSKKKRQTRILHILAEMLYWEREIRTSMGNKVQFSHETSIYTRIRKKLPFICSKFLGRIKGIRNRGRLRSIKFSKQIKGDRVQPHLFGQNVLPDLSRGPVQSSNIWHFHISPWIESSATKTTPCRCIYSKVWSMVNLQMVPKQSHLWKQSYFMLRELSELIYAIHHSPCRQKWN